LPPGLKQGNMLADHYDCSVSMMLSMTVDDGDDDIELEWKLTYVGSADDNKYDQELESVLVGPVVVGKNKFLFEAPGPDGSRIPNKDLLEVTVVLLTALYKDKVTLILNAHAHGGTVNNSLRIHLMDESNWMADDQHRNSFV
jgi:hypothetical protein